MRAEVQNSAENYRTPSAAVEKNGPTRTETPGQARTDEPGACEKCLRRGWLLGVLSTRLEYRCRDRGRLLELLALDDQELLQAVGGRRREELKARYERFDPQNIRRAEGVEAVCRHHRCYPRALVGAEAPHMLNVAGGVERLRELGTAPTVAIVGSRRATDYGMEMAKSLARGLAASGVTVTSGLGDGIAVAAHAGALEVQGGTVAVMDGGLDVACPARRRALYARVRQAGCAVAEPPCGCAPRRWGQTTRDRIIARLAWLTIVVEADEAPGELAGARMAQALGRTVAAVPGRVTSPVSRGTHALLIGGAHLVRGPQDVLELLYGMGVSPRIGSRVDLARQATSARQTARQAQAELEPRLHATLERVGAGRDTPDKLTGAGENAGEVLLALSELELMGLLARGDGGRYVPRDALPASSVR
jgi:DNA processing protein